MEGPKDLTACVQGSHVGTQPCSGGCHLQDAGGPLGPKSTMGILFILSLFLPVDQDPDAQVVTDFLPFWLSMGGLWAAWQVLPAHPLPFLMAELDGC